MPVHVEKRGNEYVVVNDITGEVEARSKTKKGAAINASYKNAAAKKKGK
jgi:hypothetical protein